ncbi:hypothetical protein [Streptomyces sp. NPDC004830]
MEDDSYARPDTRLLGAYWLDLSRLPRDHCVCHEVGHRRAGPTSRTGGVHTAVALAAWALIVAVIVPALLQ